MLKEELDRVGWSGDFDWFRRDYNRLSFEDLKYLYGIWLQKYPGQKYYDKGFFLNCITLASEELGKANLRVAELGGYNGELALEILTVIPSLNWLNIEIIAHQPVNGLEHFSYREHVLSSQLWDEHLNLSDRDVFVSGDTLEHFSNDEFEKIIGYLETQRIRYLVLKIPIYPEGQTWNGVSAAHLLTMSVEQAAGVISKFYVLLSEQVGWGWASFWRLKL
jgi:hypothetical protein